MTVSSFRLIPIDPEVAQSLRENAVVVQVADAQPGYPCRECLKDAQIGDELVLVPYDPFVTDSPYRGSSAIYLHRTPCEPWRDDGDVPKQQLGRRLSFRSFASDEMMVDAEVVEGATFVEAATRMLQKRNVEFINVHNASPGCWALRVERN